MHEPAIEAHPAASSKAISRPNARAVFKLMTSSNLVGRITGTLGLAVAPTLLALADKVIE